MFLRVRAGGEERSHNESTDDMMLEVTGDGFSYSDENGQPVSLDVTC